MADPHIQSPMDVWDKLTGIIYRTGFSLRHLASWHKHGSRNRLKLPY